MKMIALALALFVAAPAAADNLDDAWALCKGHRSVKVIKGINALIYDPGFEACAGVEADMMTRKAAAAQSRDAGDLQRLNDLRQGQ